MLSKNRNGETRRGFLFTERSRYRSGTAGGGYLWSPLSIINRASEAAMELNISIPGLDGVLSKAKKTQSDIQKAVNQTMKDCKARAPAQVTKAVTAVYAIKSSEVTAAGKAAKGGAKTVGEIKIKGVSMENIQLVYRGRLLTPTHFSMTPRTRPAGGKKYTVKAAIYKGKKKALGSSVFLAPSGALGTTEIPFKRTTDARLPIDAIRTVSIPQTIGNEKVAADIKVRLNDLLLKRLQHNIDRYAKK